VVVPLFALANAGIHLDGDLLSAAVTSPITLGVLGGYVVGKPLGIMGAAWLATRRTFGGTRLTVTWPALAGAAASAGIGFTVSLLVASLAFDHHPDLLDQAKLGVLGTAVVSPLIAWIAFQVMARLPDELRDRQLGRTAEQIIDLADDVDAEHDHIRGGADAPVTLVEYGDFECPYCGDAAPVIRKLQDHFGDDLRYVFRHLPLTDVHPGAQLAAEAAEAAGAQGAFWPMHDLLLEDQDDVSVSDLYRRASELGLDLDRFSEDLRHRRHAPRIARDVQSADASGVSGTPTFFVNGRRHEGVYDVDALTRAVKTAARSTARTAAPSRAS
jgi:protein-disulfide isomerase